MIDFSEWFHKVTGQNPFPYQTRLATTANLPLILNVPTGVGKTAAAVLCCWLWRRHYAIDEIKNSTPRRLVYCLPMRTLVEQTETAVIKWIDKAELTDKEIETHILMGGAVSKNWDINPEKNCILIGTQDQLISRALNRGYSMSKYRWPVHFALLNNDCLWVMDEVQLMGAGLRTTAQLQGFREQFKTYGISKSLWMSATLDPQLLQTVDYRPNFDTPEKVVSLNNDDRGNQKLLQRVKCQKQLQRAVTVYNGKEKEISTYAKALAAEVVKTHTSDSLTLVICNRVNRAQEIYKEIEKAVGNEIKHLLIHSRFRQIERTENTDKLNNDFKGIVVATQAIEAGVDISAKQLFTELSPWSSFVQRAGRCNRYGEQNDARIYWIDISNLSEESAIPYDIEELQECQALLNQLIEEGGEAGPQFLENFLQKLTNPPQLKISGVIPRKHDLLQLFDTSSDLAGHDVDISAFIRDADDNDVALVWRNWDGDEPTNIGDFQREEICRVSIRQAQKFLKDKQAWVFDSLEAKWKKVEAGKVYPGMSLLLHGSSGGYSEKLGFTGQEKTTKPVEEIKTEIPLITDNSDYLSQDYQEFISLKQHAQDVFAEAEKLCQDLQILELPDEIIKRAARWHDAGKAHPEFQKMLTQHDPTKLEVEIWAKSGKSLSTTEAKKDFRYLRHELVSALLALHQNEDFLLVYLVACHHGKVRMTIQPRPGETAPKDIELYALGVYHNDEIPAFDLGEDVQIEAQNLSLQCMQIGDNSESESWTAKTSQLLEEYGPFKLAFLEALVRIADWRGSAKIAGKETLIGD